MQCENCNNEHDGSYASGRFCSIKCSRGFSTKSKRQEINKKVSEKRIGSVQSEQTKKDISAKLTGRKVTWNTDTPQGRINKSASMKQFHQNMSVESKKMRSESLSKAAHKRGFGGNTSKVRMEFLKNDGTKIYLQSSYEIQYARFLEHQQIKWIRPDPLKWIDADGKSHRYYPDFYLIDSNLYVDTKNDYLIKKDEVKIESVRKQNNVTVLVISKKMLDQLPLPD